MGRAVSVDRDVVVVGGGPAGSAAAIQLARAGADVALADKASYPRDKCCGDGLTTLALRHLDELGLDPGVVASWTELTGAVVHSPSGRVTAFPLPAGAGTYGAVARRSDLDEALAGLACRSGVAVLQRAEVRSVVVEGDTVVVEAAGAGTIRAHHVVAADGAWSPLRRALGADVPGYRGDWHAFRQYFTNVSSDVAAGFHVVFEADLLPGYFWAFPVGGSEANVGFGILRGGPIPVGDMRRVWHELLQRPRIRSLLGAHAQPSGPLRAWPIPTSLGEVPLRVGRVLFAGDAAACTDPLTGEGIGQALLTGRAAADAIVATAGGTLGDAGARYEEAVRRELHADHALSRFLSRVLAHPRATRGALRLASHNAWTRRNFARWMFEDYPRALLATPRRWRAAVGAGSGAYR